VAVAEVFDHVVHPLFVQTIVNPNINKVPSDKGVIDNVLENIQPKIVRYLNSQIDGKFLVGNALLEQAFLRVLGRPRIKKPLANANLRAYFYLYDLL